jgi:transcriptional regulator with XRE-family HTH domain
MANGEKAGLPWANSRAALFLTRQIEAISNQKTQREIAAEAGFDKPNMISMMKRGESRIPWNRVPALAKALHVDPAHLFRLMLESYWPDHEETAYQIFPNRIVTKNEMGIIQALREITDNTDPHLSKELETTILGHFAPSLTA